MPTGSTSLQVLGSPPAATPPLLPTPLLLVSVLHHGVPLPQFFPSTLTLLFLELILVYLPLLGCHLNVENTPGSTDLYLELSALEGRDRSGDRAERAAGPLRYQESAVQYHCREGNAENMNKKQYLLPPLRPVTAKTCSLTHEGKNKNNSSSVFLSLSFFPLS